MTTRSRYFTPPDPPKPPGRWLHVGANPHGREVSIVLPFIVYERCYHGEWFDVMWDGSVWSPNPLEDRYGVH
jgi:hypothetical protein